MMEDENRVARVHDDLSDLPSGETARHRRPVPGDFEAAIGELLLHRSLLT